MNDRFFCSSFNIININWSRELYYILWLQLYYIIPSLVQWLSSSLCVCLQSRKFFWCLIAFNRHFHFLIINCNMLSPPILTRCVHKVSPKKEKKITIVQQWRTRIIKIECYPIFGFVFFFLKTLEIQFKVIFQPLFLFLVRFKNDVEEEKKQRTTKEREIGKFM